MIARADDETSPNIAPKTLKTAIGRGHSDSELKKSEYFVGSLNTSLFIR